MRCPAAASRPRLSLDLSVEDCNLNDETYALVLVLVIVITMLFVIIIIIVCNKHIPSHDKYALASTN